MKVLIGVPGSATEVGTGGTIWYQTGMIRLTVQHARIPDKQTPEALQQTNKHNHTPERIDFFDKLMRQGTFKEKD
jgi:hypothetical protein